MLTNRWPWWSKQRHLENIGQKPPDMVFKVSDDPLEFATEPWVGGMSTEQFINAYAERRMKESKEEALNKELLEQYNAQTEKYSLQNEVRELERYKKEYIEKSGESVDERILESYDITIEQFNKALEKFDLEMAERGIPLGKYRDKPINRDKDKNKDKDSDKNKGKGEHKMDEAEHFKDCAVDQSVAVLGSLAAFELELCVPGPEDDTIFKFYLVKDIIFLSKEELMFHALVNYGASKEGPKLSDYPPIRDTENLMDYISRVEKLENLEWQTYRFQEHLFSRIRGRTIYTVNKDQTYTTIKSEKFVRTHRTEESSNVVSLANPKKPDI